MSNPFLDACGATGPLLLNTESPGAPGGETRAFDLPFVLAGSDPRSDLRLTHPEVSERHAYLQLVDGQLLCFDLGSRTGIYQAGKCQRLGFMERDRPIRIGPYRVRLLGGDGAAAVDCEAPCPPLPLELSHRSVRHSRCDLPRGLALVGNATDCQIRLIDPSLSNYHCSLVRTPQGVWVVDLLGEGGVRVNGQDVAYAQLHPGDALQIGHSVIRLVTDADPPRPAVTVRPAAPFVDAAVIPQTLTTPSPAPSPAALMSELAEVEPHPQAAQAAELVERVLGPVVSQVEHLRQQMAEEFNQSRTMLFDTFATLHQEQTAFVNQELEQLRQLSRELHALRAELERQARSPVDRPSAATPPTDARLGVATPSPTRSITHVASSHPGAGPIQGKLTHTTPPPQINRHDVENNLIRAHNEQAHARLSNRITSLKKKQQTRWERLLAMFPGTRAEKPRLQRES